jgi:hypothetical protein
MNLSQSIETVPSIGGLKDQLLQGVSVLVADDSEDNVVIIEQLFNG